MKDKQLHIEFLDHQSEMMSKVKKLSDANIKTLGMLPYAAFNEAAKEKNILIARINSDLVGYILIRKVKSRNQIVIVHFCIDDKYRGHNYGEKLFSILKTSAEGFSSIQLKCRSDYSVSEFWPKLGFQIIAKVDGRKKTGSVLNVWYYKLHKESLFDVYYQPDFDKIPIVLDSNIVIDLYKNEALNYIFEDWIEDELEFWITPEFFNELDAYEDLEERDKINRFGQVFFCV